jgi:hypothetical protein
MDAEEEISMNPKKLLESHKIPCGPMSVSADSICRRRLRDHIDNMLDKLTQETHPEGVDPEILAMEEKVEIPEPEEAEETDEQKRDRMLAEGKMKIDVKRELAKYETDTANEPEVEAEEEETDEEMKKRLVKEGKMKVDVRKVVQKYEDKVMPKPKEKPKPKTSDHAETVEEEDEEQGNSKLLQRLDGKMTRWQGKG